jgi:RecA/RadA recombinase
MHWDLPTLVMTLLPQWLTVKIESKRLSDPDLVKMDVDDVMDYLQVSRVTAELVVQDACSRYASKPVLARDIPAPVRFMGLDMLRSGSITEVYGPSGSGKTQLCLTLAASDLFNTVFWLDTEGTYRSERLLEIGGLRCLDKVKVKSVRDFDTMFWTVSKAMQNIITSEMHPTLVVIDSIAAPLRSTDKLMDRQRSIHSLAEALKKLGACVLVTNHVIAHMSTQDAFLPALGNTWSHAVNTRILMFKEEHTRRRFIRPVKILSSPPCDDIEFGITRSGVSILH